LKIRVETVKELRDQSGAAIMQCQSALIEAEGDIEKALQILKQKSLFQAEKKASRATGQGLVEAYIHAGGRIGAMVEVNCETDFVARTDEFKELAHHLAMQVAAMNPRFISEEDVPPKSELEPQTDCLLLQADIKEPERTVKEIIAETIAKVGENIRVSRFARFELGEAEAEK
jgi:elongation factor Ts